LALIVLGILRRGIGWLQQPILLWAFMALVVWGAVYGFASYQNLGTAFRFRAQVTPILLLLGLYLTFGTALRPARYLGLRAQPGPAPAAPAAPDRAGAEPAQQAP
jgi:hypothetical protein